MDVVFLDFTKAFDVINLNLLASKLSALGFDSQIADRIRSFVCGRSMSVIVGGVCS